MTHPYFGPVVVLAVLGLVAAVFSILSPRAWRAALGLALVCAAGAVFLMVDGWPATPEPDLTHRETPAELLARLEEGER